jgi:hypothetical protein
MTSMTSETRTNSNGEASPDLQAITSDIAALKRDLASLLRNVKGDVAGEASRVYERMAAQGERSVKALGRQVDEQPVMSLLIAFAVGFIGSRFLSR